jgi:hypothetical protein
VDRLKFEQLLDGTCPNQVSLINEPMVTPMERALRLWFNRQEPDHSKMSIGGDRCETRPARV